MLDKYVIVERIAVGGMGEVFVARQEGVGNFRRTVVLKKLLPDAEGSDEAATRLLDEARINGSLSHENVVTILEVGTGSEPGKQGAGKGAALPWLALEYVHGENCGTLRTRAGKRGIAIPLVVAAQIVKDSARGLQHAHAAKDVDGRAMNIIHRDIAPKNIFVRFDGVSKVGDFGIARADARLSHTATGAIAGTLTYMSPEQLSAKEMTPLSDQFALGIVFWELLTGRRLFKGDGPVETAEKILSGKIRAPSRYRPDIESALGGDVAKAVDAIVLRMLQRDPLQRFPDCGEVADAIEAVVKDVASSVGRAAVAAFVEELAGDELRERQKRIEEGAEQTTRADRPAKNGAWDDPSSSRKNSDAAVVADVVADGLADKEVVAGEPTVREGANGSAQNAIKPITRPTRPTPSSPKPAPAWTQPSRWSRAPLYAAVVGVCFVVGVAVAVVVRDDAPDADRQLRAYLHEAQRTRPLSFREAVVVYAVDEGVDEAQAERLAADLTALLRERLALVVGWVDRAPAERARETVAVRQKERALLDRLHQRLAQLPDDKAELKGDIVDMFQDDSSVPLRFLPPLTLEQIQGRVYPNGIQLMHDSRDERWDKVARIARRAGVDPAVVRARIEPLALKREALIEAFGTAAPEALAGLEDEEEAIAAAGAAALDGLVADDVAAAIAYVAFIDLPSSKRGPPELDPNADTGGK